jgi:dipeptidyl aminopeptidase/acylaminoacyl peptidase
VTNDTIGASAVSGTESTPFHDLAAYMAIPRVTGVRLSPDGSWLAAAVQTLSADKKKYVTSIWRIGAGGGQPRRLTRSAEGEGSPRFLPDGSLLFTSKRPDPDAGPDGEPAGETAALWLLPPGGGEARVIAALPGGVVGAEVAANAQAIVVASPVLPQAGAEMNGHRDAAGAGPDGPAPGAGDATRGVRADGNGRSAEDDARLRKERKDAGVTAILHESVPVRYWDHDLGPADVRLFAVGGPSGPDRLAADGAAADGQAGDGPAAVRDLTPDAGRALLEQSFDVSPDGALAAAGWWRWRGTQQSYSELVLIDVATGKRRILLSDPEFSFGSPRFSPDGRSIACVRATHHTPERPRDATIVVATVDEAAVGTGNDLLPRLDRWPDHPVWAPDGRSVYFTADDRGRHPVFRVSVDTGEVARVTTDNGAYADLNPDGGFLYALRAAVDEPPTPVRIDLAAPGAGPQRLASPGSPLKLPGKLTEFETTADDGHPIRSWLVLPGTASPETPAPLLLWVHGGPMMSWNSWTWRWNAWLMAAQGYAVLLPDPALSTGYGQDFIARGYHSWGPRPFADVMAATDAALERPDIDADRTAMMGGSYGGYMANWVAGHTDRFRAIVSHAGLWVLDQMFGTTDMPMFWRPQFGDPLISPEMYEKNSPHRHIANVRTPMLVIHGNKDYRVPLGEALRLWWDLSRYGADAKFLYFPDENHWILTPGNAAIWYKTVFAFLDHHVRDQPWRRPDLL